MHEKQNIFLEKIRHFNTRILALQYKNTNRYQAKLIEKYTRKTQKKI
jgi:hypothetical protein